MPAVPEKGCGHIFLINLSLNLNLPDYLVVFMFFIY
jgi:hypothetical protein